MTVLSTSSSNGHCVVPIVLESGIGSWEFVITKDSKDNEMSCVGACTELNPSDSSYQSSKSMYQYRGYNGCTYNKGSTGKSLSKFHQSDVVKMIADLDEGTINCEVNGVPQSAPVFTGVKG